MTRVLVVAAALVAAVAVLIRLSLPPVSRTLTAGASDGTVPGTLHVHTARSDGRGTPDEVAAAAARAGLTFVVFADHGDGTRRPDPPVYRSGVLCLDGVEISTNGGHYVAIGMNAAPYPLAGDARDVVDDVRRLGGFGIIAHPDSPKPALAWHDWTAPFDAMETVNPDTSWRAMLADPNRRPRLQLAEALLAYPFRPREAIANLLRGTTEMYRWTALATRRRVVTLAGVDAHAKIAPKGDPIDNRFSLPLPSYEATFGALSVHVRPERPLSGDAEADASMLLRAIRAGHVYTAVDGLATPPSFDFTATNGHGTVRGGDEIVADGPLTLRVRSNAPDDYITILWNGAEVVGDPHTEREFTVTADDQPGVYWVEIRWPHHVAAPWIASNPVYVRAAETKTATPVRPAATQRDLLFNGESTSGWRVERDDGSLGAVEASATLTGAALRFRYALGGGDAAGQYSALLVDRPEGIAGQDRLSITMRAEKPMRVSLQLRAPRPDEPPERWERSLYVDTVNQERTIFLDEFRPVGETDSYRPNLAAVRSVMVVVDTTNTKPGASGRLWVNAASLQH